MPGRRSGLAGVACVAVDGGWASCCDAAGFAVDAATVVAVAAVVVVCDAEFLVGALVACR